MSTAVTNLAGRANTVAKFLVASRVDRGDPNVSSDAIQNFNSEHNFVGYFRTSARTKLGVDELRKAALAAIDWESLPSISSTKMFQEVQGLILSLQEQSIHILPMTEAYDRLVVLSTGKKPTLGEFRTCVALLESRGLVRRLSFDDSVLLAPEFLDSYASAIVNQARVDPNGLGSIRESDILNVKFSINQAERIADSSLERNLVIATLEDIIIRQLAFRENTSDGTIIVFPSQFTRENPDLPAPDGIELRLRFKGPLQNIYSIMTVRMFYAWKEFRITEIWRNGIVIRDSQDRRAGYQISDFADGQGEIALFFEQGIDQELKHRLVDFVQQHVFEQALAGSIRVRRSLLCTKCGTEFTDAQIERRRARGYTSISCNVCGTDNQIDPIDDARRTSAQLPSTIAAIADAQVTTEREANLSVGTALIRGEDIQRWIREGAQREPHLVVLFTDIVGSTRTTNDLGDIAMEEAKAEHFAKLGHYAERFQGRIIKGTGDGVLAIFKSAIHAAQFSIASWKDTGHKAIKLRIGFHLGRVVPTAGDISGQTVNYAARVQGTLKETGIVASDDAKREFDRLLGNHQKFVRFELREGVVLSGFEGNHRVWHVKGFVKRFLEMSR